MSTSPEINAQHEHKPPAHWPTLTIRFNPTDRVVAALKRCLEDLAEAVEWKDPFAK